MVQLLFNPYLPGVINPNTAPLLAHQRPEIDHHYRYDRDSSVSQLYTVRIDSEIFNRTYHSSLRLSLDDPSANVLRFDARAEHRGPSHTNWLPVSLEDFLETRGLRVNVKHVLLGVGVDFSLDLLHLLRRLLRAE